MTDKEFEEKIQKYLKDNLSIGVSVRPGWLGDKFTLSVRLGSILISETEFSSVKTG